MLPCGLLTNVVAREAETPNSRGPLSRIRVARFLNGGSRCKPVMHGWRRRVVGLLSAPDVRELRGGREPQQRRDGERVAQEHQEHPAAGGGGEQADGDHARGHLRHVVHERQAHVDDVRQIAVRPCALCGRARECQVRRC
jgi:hypothetical protein